MKLTISQINKPWDDNALFVENNLNNSAWLLDCGSLHALALRDLMRISHVFISHAHIDHFFGIDRWVRMNLLTNRTLSIYGPPGFAAVLAHKLKGYSWDMDDEFNMVIDAYELYPETFVTTRFFCARGFEADPPQEKAHAGFMELPFGARLRFASAVHRELTPCLAYVLEEPDVARVDKQAVSRLGIKPGAWLRELRERANSQNAQGEVELDGRLYPWRELLDSCVNTEKGERYAYITDSIFNKVSVKNFRSLGVGVKELWCEACYYDRLEAARRFCHFTVKQTARLAVEMQAEKLFLLHLSRRLATEEDFQRHLEAARAVFPNTCDPRYYVPSVKREE